MRGLLVASCWAALLRWIRVGAPETKKNYLSPFGGSLRRRSTRHAIWERNVDTVRAINKQTSRSTPRGVIAQSLLVHLKGRAIALAKPGSQPSAATSDS